MMMRADEGIGPYRLGVERSGKHEERNPPVILRGKMTPPFTRGALKVRGRMQVDEGIGPYGL